MKTIFIKPEEKDITAEMLEEYPIVEINGKKYYNLGYFIKNNKIYKALSIVEEEI